MSKIFVAGSISIRQLDPRVKARLDRIVAGDHTVIIGDANGADSSVQAYLSGKDAAQAIVYCSEPKPRNNLGGWAKVADRARCGAARAVAFIHGAAGPAQGRRQTGFALPLQPVAQRAACNVC